MTCNMCSPLAITLQRKHKIPAVHIGGDCLTNCLLTFDLLDRNQMLFTMTLPDITQLVLVMILSNHKQYILLSKLAKVSGNVAIFVSKISTDSDFCFSEDLCPQMAAFCAKHIMRIQPFVGIISFW